MRLKHWSLCCATAFAALAQSGRGQPASPWRTFKASDGMAESSCVSVTVGAQGRILVRHLNRSRVTTLDGYGISTIASPRRDSARVYESPAGQLWSAAPNGLKEFKGNHWALYPVPEIAATSRSTNTNPPSDIPLCPVRHGHVLVLLPDRLLAFNAEDPEHVKTETLRLAAQTRLGSFLGLSAAGDGGLWISGARGLAKLPAPVRNLKTDSPWQEFELPDAPRFQNLREPRESMTGTLTALAELANSGDQVIVQFDGQRWTNRPAWPERIRFAWNDQEQTCWAVTADRVLSQRADRTELVPDEEFFAREIFDVATEAGGFWLATSDGLFRYASPVWRTPVGVPPVHGPVHPLAKAGASGLWFVAGGELHSLDGAQHRVFPVPASYRPALQSVRAIIPLPNKTLLLDTEEQLFQFRPATRIFESVLGNRSGRIKFLGLLNDGVACVERFYANVDPQDSRLEIYDGDQFRAFPGPRPAFERKGVWLALFQSRNGDLWLSESQTVLRQREGQWREFSAADKTAPEGARLFAETGDGRVWCATPDTLWMYDGRNWALIRTGFDHINSLACDQNDHLWLASDSGLHRLTPLGWIDSGIQEGLPATTVRSICRDGRNRLWAGTSQGLSLYHPEADPDPPRTEILSPPDKRIPEGGNITLTLRGKDKWNFSPRNRLLYSHRLDVRDWSPFQEADTVTLTDLPAGKHSFQARALDRNGNIELKPAQFLFTVALPWYREPRLVLIAGAGLAAAVFFAALAFNRHRQLRRSYASVEQQVAERTRELELVGRELLHSQKMNALGTLAAGIAHDFNNMLSIIKGSTQIIEESTDNPDIRTNAARIKTVVDQGTRVVQAMLGFSRGSDKQLVPSDLNAIVDDTLNLLGGRFRREVEIRFERAPSLPQIPVAKDLIQQILLNFMFNAAESMTKQKRVILTTQQIEKLPPHAILLPAVADSYLSISVQDFGSGITPEHLPRIFEPFFTTKALSARRGTGLGLSMVYELAKKMGAGIAVKTHMNHGSTFTLILPVSTAPPVAGDLTEKPTLITQEP